MLNRDFKEFVELLNQHSVDYLVVGGYALAVHGFPRYTGDLDIWINPSPENARKMTAVMDKFGLGSLELSAEDFTRAGNVIQIGYPPIRIDIITKPDGVEFEACYANRLLVDYQGLTIPVIGLDDLKKNKQASGRPKDRWDLANLE